MLTPTVPVPEFVPVSSGYAVRLCGAVIGYVAKCERNPSVWNAYVDADRTRVRAQRGTRGKAAAALMLRPTRDPEIPDEAIDLLARVIVGDRPILDGAARDYVRDVLMLPTRLTVAHTLRAAADDVHDCYPDTAAWLEQRADEIDGGELR